MATDIMTLFVGGSVSNGQKSRRGVHHMHKNLHGYPLLRACGLRRCMIGRKWSVKPSIPGVHKCLPKPGEEHHDGAA